MYNVKHVINDKIKQHHNFFLQKNPLLHWDVEIQDITPVMTYNNLLSHLSIHGSFGHLLSVPSPLFHTLHHKDPHCVSIIHITDTNIHIHFEWVCYWDCHENMDH